MSEENKQDEEDFYDTSDKEEVNTRRKKASRTRADRLEFITAAMGLPEGRAWFYDHLMFCKAFETPYRSDPYDTAFALGHQNIGFKVLDDIQTAAPDKYLLMIQENKKKKE
jgi:hypothetical protein